jgi:hypothetical protein
MRTEMIRIAESVLIPAAPAKIDAMGQAEWKKFIEELQALYQIADKIIELFGDKLDPQILTLLLDIQDTVSGRVVSYMTWPDVYGVPDDRLSLSKHIRLKRNLNSIAAEDVRKLLSIAIKLLQQIEQARVANKLKN